MQMNKYVWLAETGKTRWTNKEEKSVLVCMTNELGSLADLNLAWCIILNSMLFYIYQDV